MEARASADCRGIVGSRQAHRDTGVARNGLECGSPLPKLSSRFKPPRLVFAFCQSHFAHLVGGRLHEEVEEYFALAERSNFKNLEYDYCGTLGKDHGRIEERRCGVTEDTEWFTEKAEWVGLRSFIMVERKREVRGQEASLERRYFISSLAASAKEALRCARWYWRIKHSSHWVLDVAFHEDACRTQTGDAPENLATSRHIAVYLLKQEHSCELGVKSKRLKAGRNESYMLTVLNI